jgi:hypothetical protein
MAVGARVWESKAPAEPHLQPERFPPTSRCGLQPPPLVIHSWASVQTSYL